MVRVDNVIHQVPRLDQGRLLLFRLLSAVNDIQRRSPKTDSVMLGTVGWAVAEIFWRFAHTIATISAVTRVISRAPGGWNARHAERVV
jgi:hypothetical protein